MGNRAPIAHFGSLDAQLLGASVDALTAGPLVVKDMEERGITIEGHTLDATQLPVDIFDTATAFDELLMSAGGPGLLWKEQGALEALSTVAVGMVELERGMHGQADGTTRSAVSQASKGRFAVLIERNRRNAALTGCRLVDVPRIIGRIGRQIGGKLVEGHDGVLIQGTKIGDIAFVEGLSVVGQHDGAIVSDGTHRDARAIAPRLVLS